MQGDTDDRAPTELVLVNGAVVWPVQLSTGAVPVGEKKPSKHWPAIGVPATVDDAAHVTKLTLSARGFGLVQVITEDETSESVAPRATPEAPRGRCVQLLQSEGVGAVFTVRYRLGLMHAQPAAPAHVAVAESHTV
jgi:hypothetical protein